MGVIGLGRRTEKTCFLKNDCINFDLEKNLWCLVAQYLKKYGI